MGRKIGFMNLVNYRRHPRDQNYLVFNFNTLPEADMFEKELVARKIRFEKDMEEVKGNLMYLFAVQDGSMDEVTKVNALVHKTFKQPIFKNALIRYSLLIFLLLLTTMAIIGYVKNSKNVSHPTEQIEKDSL